jgi:ankyrin repeat protein
LEWIRLSKADLSSANLTEADLGSATLKGANLGNANLKGARLAWANYDKDTIWPEGFDPVKANAKLEQREADNRNEKVRGLLKALSDEKHETRLAAAAELVDHAISKLGDRQSLAAAFLEAAEEGRLIRYKDILAYRGEGLKKWFDLPEVVDWFIERGANVNAVNSTTGETALSEAIALGAVKSVEVMIKNGADVNARSLLDGGSPLHRVFNTNYFSDTMMDMLIKAGADMNARDSFGNTPLMIAARRNFRDLVHILLIAGADMNLLDASGKTALQLAEESNARWCADLIRAYAQKNQTDPAG